MNKQNDRLHDIAKRIDALIAPWDKVYEGIDELADHVNSDPMAVIEFLLDMIDEA